MPKVSDLFKSPMLRAPNLGGVQPITILTNRAVSSNGANYHVLDVDMKGERNVIRLSATLAHDIEAVLGENELDKWCGQVISIYPAQMKLKDRDTGEEKIVDLIRAAAAPAGTKPSTMALSISKNPDDEIPF